MDHAAGDAVVIIDSDLQDPPEVIPQMLAKWEEGYKVVYGQRAKRKGETAFKLLTAKAFYRLLERLSEVRIPLDTGDFRLVDKAVIRTLQTMREENRYVRGLVAWTGFPSYGVTYERDARYAGETKYSLRKMAKFAFDGITSFSDKPLQLSSLLGGVVAFSAVLVIFWAVARELLFPETTIEGWVLVLAAVLFLGGLQLLSLGIIGQYIGRICREVRQRPLYVLSEKLGFGDDPSPISDDQRRTGG